VIIKLNKDNINETKIALDKIARETGEDEDPNIQLLAENGIWVSKEEIEFFSCRHLCLYVLEPFQDHQFEEIKKKIQKVLPSYKTKCYLKVIKKDGKEYIKYPRLVEDWKISQNILEDLKERHMINNDFLTEDEWIEIQSLEPWKRCERQVAREIIALDICNHLNIST
jgi:hypothetical protein